MVHPLHSNGHMASSTTRRLQDWLIASFGFGVVVSGMAAIDETSHRTVDVNTTGLLPCEHEVPSIANVNVPASAVTRQAVALSANTVATTVSPASVDRHS